MITPQERRSMRRRMRHVLVQVLATLVLIIVAAVATLGITYWAMARRFVAGDAHALDGIPMPVGSSERRANMREARVLRAVFLAGAVTDAVALLPMLLPSFATLLWGLRDVSDSYQLAMRCAASLMLGWTL